MHYNEQSNGLVLAVLDFAENHTAQTQGECQSAHWTNSTLVFILCYYRDTEAGTLITDIQVFISTHRNQDCHFGIAITRKSLQGLKEKGLQVTQVTQFRNGCSAQCHHSLE